MARKRASASPADATRTPGPAGSLERLFQEAGFTLQQYRLADGILEGTQRWVCDLAGSLQQLESVAPRPRDGALRAARLDTERLAEQLEALRALLRQTMAAPQATLH